MILVTGATGHLGNVLVRKLIESGEKVRVFVYPNDDLKPIEGLEVEKVWGDIRNLEDVENACNSVDTVFHLAGMISILPWRNKVVEEINVKGVENILKACKKHEVKRLIYTSSVHAFMEPELGSVITEETPIDPKRTKGAYGKSKALATLKVMNAAKAGLDAVVVCPTGIIGPYDFKLSEMGKFFLRFLTSKLRYGVSGSFDFVDVRDVAEGLIKAWKFGKSGQFYILGNKNISIEELLKLLSEYTGKRNEIKILKKNTAYFISMFTTFQCAFGKKPIFTPYSVHTLTRNYTFSHEKAKKELGYNPRPFENTIRDTLNWLIEFFKINNNPVFNLKDSSA
jgi:dihydroflavonol-4-reductase